MRAEQLTDPVAYHGEGPVWSPRWGGLRWVDLLAGDILSLGVDGRVGRRHVGAIAAALRPRRAGGAVIAVERGFLLEEEDGTLTSLGELWRDPGVRMNEGGCDPEGRFYAGSMAYDQKPGAASLYRLNPDRSTEVILTGVTISNGIDWSPDAARAYFNDTARQQISVFDFQPNRGLHHRRVFVDLSTEAPSPDGLTVDSEGCVWVALAAGGAVRRYTPTGALDGEIQLPARKVTACTFGGPDLKTLFITTSREGLEPDEEPLAGALFSATPGVAGLPVREFAG